MILLAEYLILFEVRGLKMPQISKSVGLGGVNRDSDTRTIQNLLNRHIRKIPPTRPLVVDGDVGGLTVGAIRGFQSQVMGSSNPDGRVDPGKNTIRALNDEAGIGPSAANRYHYPVGPQEPLADIALPYVGAREASTNRMGTDPRMREIFEADRYAPDGSTDGYAWCCSFVSMCVQKLIAQDTRYSGITPPRTPGVSTFRTVWAPRQNCAIFTSSSPDYSPHRGDIVVFTFSHIGIVTGTASGAVETIEGNTNSRGSRDGGGCMKKTRKLDLCRCFIRLPVPEPVVELPDPFICELVNWF